jgi:hypothetical protein
MAGSIAPRGKVFWNPNIEQWRKFAIWEGYGIPPDLILALIAGESGGKAGEPGNRKTNSRDHIPKADGSTVYVERALGLMQCVPSTILWYNQEHPQNPATFEDMTGSNDRAARMQIKMGAWVYKHNIAGLKRWYPAFFQFGDVGRATENQLQLALIAYGIGMGNLKRKLDKLGAAGERLDVRSLQKAFPKWGFDTDTGKWRDRPLQSAGNKWSMYMRHRTGDSTPIGPFNPTGQPEMPPQGPLAKLKKAGLMSSPLLIGAMLMLAWVATKKYFGGDE